MDEDRAGVENMEREISMMRSRMEREFSKMRLFMRREVLLMRQQIDVLLRRLAMESKKLRMRKRIDNLLKKIELEEDYKRMKINMEKEFSRIKYIMEIKFLNMRKLIGCPLMGSFRNINKMDAEVIHDTGSSDDNASDGDKQQINKNYEPYHGSKLLKSTLSLSSFFVPCVGGTGNGSSHQEHQDYSEIYRSTLDYVNNCPSPKEYMKKSLEKCAGACRSYMQDGNCAYHCMRDSSKTRLVEFCAKTELLFEYCPEFDPVDQTIQKDVTTLCNTKYSRIYYNSSDIYFCDPDNCLWLHESSEHTGATTLTTLMNETTEINSGESQEWFIPLILVVTALIVAIFLGCILRVFLKRRVFSARKMAKKRNRNGIQNENDNPLV